MFEPQARGWAIELWCCCCCVITQAAQCFDKLHVFTCQQARGWAIELCAGVDDDGYSANTAAYLFTVSIVLTEAGLAAGPGCGLAPVALLFQYLRLLTETGAVHLISSLLCIQGL